MSNILFHSNQLDLRGTSTALYDYAYFNETILGNKSFIAAPINSDLSSQHRFHKSFCGRVFLYETLGELQVYCRLHCIDVVYWIKYGTDDSNTVPGVKNVVHVVFDGSTPHSNKYAAVSKWLGDKYNIPYVPHIVSLPDIKEDYREHLGIPKEALVFGRHGGNDSFDDSVAWPVVTKVARQRPDVYFLFMNTDVFCPSLPNVIHIDPTTDEEVKTAFINTCDAMLHCRMRGETFGLSVCEFLHQDKPVITRIDSPERNHIQVMGDKGFYYSSSAELEAILTHLKRPEGINYSKLVEQFSPERVMEQFNNTFLK